MKLKITYQPEEQEQATRVLAVLLRLLPGARVHKAMDKPPYIRIYITTRRSGGP